MYCQLR